MIPNKIKLDLTLVDRNNKRHSWSPDVIFQFAGAVPLGGPGTENKDFEWGHDLTAQIERSDNPNQLYKDLYSGKAKLEISFSERTTKEKIEFDGTLKEVELMFWSSKGKKTSSKKLLTEDKSLKEPLKVTFPL